jgi:hypothetical protein
MNKVNSAGWSQERNFFLFDHQLVYCKKVIGVYFLKGLSTSDMRRNVLYPFLEDYIHFLKRRLLTDKLYMKLKGVRS